MITVLIVEDDPLIAEGQAAGERLGVRGAGDTPVDLVLLDLGLPDASGISLASALSGLQPAPDIIAITSERDLEMVRAAVSHGALAYLLKPFTFAAFRDRLERYRRYRGALPSGIEAASELKLMTKE